jgi:hypothetical protein
LGDSFVRGELPFLPFRDRVVTEVEEVGQNLLDRNYTAIPEVLRSRIVARCVQLFIGVLAIVEITLV